MLRLCMAHSTRLSVYEFYTSKPLVRCIYGSRFAQILPPAGFGLRFDRNVALAWAPVATFPPFLPCLISIHLQALGVVTA